MAKEKKVEKYNVRENWYSNGQKEYEEYWLNGERHREDGPAVQGWYVRSFMKNIIWMENIIGKMDLLVNIGIRMVRSGMNIIWMEKK